MKNENINDEQESINKSRRKLSKTSLAAPVLLSLTSKPSWAFVCTFSGAMSGNLSAEKAGAVCDQGLLSTEPPSYYSGSTPTPAWPHYVSGNGSGATQFNTVFGSPAIKIGGNTTPTFSQVLANPTGVKFAVGGASDNGCAAQYVTAVLNAYNTPLLLFPYTPQQIIADWASRSKCVELTAIQTTSKTVAQVAALINF